MPATTISSPTSGSNVIQGHMLAISNSAVLVPGDIWSYSIGMSPWANIIPRGEFKKGMGTRQRAMHFDRSLAGTTGKLTWANHNALGFSSAATGNTPPDIAVGSRSLPPVTVIQATQKVDEWGLKWAAWESPRFDVRDAVFNFNFIEQFAAYYEKTKEAAGRAWEYELRETYFDKCKYKILLGVPEAGTPTNCYADLTVTGPTSFSTMTGYTDAQLNMTDAAPANGYSSKHSVLTNGVLQDIKAKLIRHGADKLPSLAGNIPLVCSPEQKFYLLHEPGMRSDLRYGDSGKLLKAMGENYTTTFLGINFIPDNEVPRFTLAKSGTSAFTEILPWTYQAGNLSTSVSSAATYASGVSTELTVTSTTGIVANNAIRLAPTSASDDEYSGEFTVLAVTSATTLIINKEFTDTCTATLYLLGNGEAGWVPNPSYDVAPYEMSFFVFPTVLEIQTLDYPTTLGQGSSFTGAAKPLGSARWVNYENEDWNPDGTMGFYRGTFEYAAKPKMTEHGYAIMHRRAPSITLASPSFAIAAGLGLLS